MGFGGQTMVSKCEEDNRNQRLQLGNLDRSTGKCCSGIRAAGSNDCFDNLDARGPHWYSCDVTGQNMNQQFRLRSDGRIEVGPPESGRRRKNSGSCMVVNEKEKIEKKACKGLAGDEGVFQKISDAPSQEWGIYRDEITKHRYLQDFADLPDN